LQKGSPKATAAAGDPLIGGDPVPNKSTPTAAPSKTKSAALPPLPSSSSATTTAAMAIGEPLPGSKTLAIDDGRNTPGGGWQGGEGKGGTSATLTGVQVAGAGVQLHRPEPIVEPVPRPVPVALPPAVPAVTPASFSTVPAGALENEQLQALLKARGVSWQHQERVAEGVKFICAVPNRHNPDISRIYEATAADYASAVRAVLPQIDAQQQ
jgi:hypothetical protein